jgi:chaperonin GroES
MTLTPLYDRVLVERIEADQKTAGGLYIPDAAREKPQMGVVKAVGPGYRENGLFQPMQAAPGNKVLFGKYSGQEVTVDDQTFLILREEEILAIVNE